MKRNLIAASLLLNLAFGATVLAVSSPFPDVEGNTEHAVAIDFLKSKGIIGGYPDGSFKPENTINRAEALKLLFLSRKALNITDPTLNKTVTFPDVKASDWYYDYVQNAYNSEIVSGYSDGYFKPANEITKSESWKIILTGLVPDFKTPSVITPPYFNIKLDSWFAPYIDYAKAWQFLDAEGNGGYSAEKQMTRAEFAEAIYRVMYVQINKADKFPLSLNWRYCNNFSLGYKVKRPYSWETIVAGDQQIFWKKDQENGQVSFARVYPNSAVAVVALEANNQHLGLQEYLNQIEYGPNSTKQVITLNGLPYASVFIEQSGLQDSYFQLPSGQILIIYAQVGDGALARQLKEEIRYIIGSVRESKAAGTDEDNCLAVKSTNGTEQTTSPITDLEKLKADILALVLVNGKSAEGLDKLNDELLFETDSIGIGTGPVDYYYSAQIDLSLKIDRNSATILATKSGKTSVF